MLLQQKGKRMKKYLSVLKMSRLFSGVDENDIEAMLSCLGTCKQSYKKGEYVFQQGDHIDKIAVLAEGELHIQRDDYWGKRSLLSTVLVGEMFGEAHMAPESEPAIFDLVAATDSVVIFFDPKKVITTCSSACRFHTMVVQNLFYAFAEKNHSLVQKLGHISQHSTREKLISYLSEQARRQNSGSFTVPFNRQQLADFLSVDRSAMSNELCKLRDEGLLEFRKNRFRLLQGE